MLARKLRDLPNLKMMETTCLTIPLEGIKKTHQVLDALLLTTLALLDRYCPDFQTSLLCQCSKSEPALRLSTQDIPLRKSEPISSHLEVIQSKINALLNSESNTEELIRVRICVEKPNEYDSDVSEASLSSIQYDLLLSCQYYSIANSCIWRLSGRHNSKIFSHRIQH